MLNIMVRSIDAVGVNYLSHEVAVGVNYLSHGVENLKFNVHVEMADVNRFSAY